MTRAPRHHCKTQLRVCIMSMADRDEATKAVIEGLKRLYHNKLKPLEQLYMFDFFNSPLLTDSEFDSKPQVP